MIKYITLLVLLITSIAAAADISIVMRGRWTASCNGVWISQHNRYDKALEAVINQNTDCDILPPNVFEIRPTAEPEPEPIYKDIVIKWKNPTRREDDSTLTAIDRLNIYYDLDGVFQGVIEVEAGSNSYTLANVSTGSYDFRMSTVSNGAEGSKSGILKIQVN